MASGFGCLTTLITIWSCIRWRVRLGYVFFSFFAQAMYGCRVWMLICNKQTEKPRLRTVRLHREKTRPRQAAQGLLAADGRRGAGRGPRRRRPQRVPEAARAH